MLLVMSLVVRNLIFTVVVPGAGAVYGPWWILTRGGASPTPTAWPALAVIVVGAAGYLWCLWVFATSGAARRVRGMPRVVLLPSGRTGGSAIPCIWLRC